jgi:hypothetical protein
MKRGHAGKANLFRLAGTYLNIFSGRASPAFNPCIEHPYCKDRSILDCTSYAFNTAQAISKRERAPWGSLGIDETYSLIVHCRGVFCRGSAWSGDYVYIVSQRQACPPHPIHALL